ncbi:MAG: TonB-dependent receptor [Candidatus Binatia bacterium]
MRGQVETAPPAAGRAAPDAERAAIVGTVIDASTAYPVVGALIEVVGQKARAESDLDGKFRLRVPPGTYELRISADLYKTRVLKNVKVAPGASTEVKASLPPNVAGNVQLVEVRGEAKKATEEAQLIQRKESRTVAETMGAETISKSTDSDAAEVVTRVPAVTIKDDKFIVVRGLSERYSSALLNGSRLPSTDPNRRIVPLDLFPAEFIESLSIIKSYTPDLPGDFAGGLVSIDLAEPSPHLTYSLGMSTAANTVTTFQDYETYDGSTLDWFTLGDGPRDLPAIFGNGDLPSNIPTQQQRAYVGSLMNNWDVFNNTAPPNFGIDGTVSNSFGPWGFNFGATYGWKFQVHRDEVANSFPNEQSIEQDGGDRFTYMRSDFETHLGALFTTQYRLSNDHKISGRSLVNRKSVDEVLNGSGTTEALQGREQFATSTSYTANQLGLGQLEGRHHFSVVDVDWRAAWGPSSQDVPDSKFYVYERERSDPSEKPALIDRQPSTQRTFQTLNEFLQDYFLDMTVPFETRLPFTDVWRGLAARLKFGGAYALRDRSFLFRAYRSDIVESSTPRDFLTQPPGVIFRPLNYSEQGPLRFQGFSFEPFDASQEIAAGYGMVDLPLLPDTLRFIGGARAEYSYLTTTARSRQLGIIDTILNDLDPLPGVSLIYSPRDDMNVRSAYSMTVARPEFRELTPTQFPTLPGERTLQGNPFLVTSHITNYDLRWEWFFSPLEIASVGFFYKDLEDPIELITAVDASNFIDTFVNADSATVWGFELELRKDFQFLVAPARRVTWLSSVAPVFNDLKFLLNVSLVESEVSGFTAPPNLVIAPIPGSRRLQGQAPYVINAALEYDSEHWGVARLLYNTVGPTIDAAGTDINPESPAGMLPDIIQERRDSLDAAWLLPVEPFGVPMTLKVAAENILNDRFLETQGSAITSRYRNGVTFSFGLSYTY